MILILSSPFNEVMAGRQSVLSEVTRDGQNRIVRLLTKLDGNNLGGGSGVDGKSREQMRQGVPAEIAFHSGHLVTSLKFEIYKVL